MKLIDIFTFSISGLKERKFRVALNLVGILIGCAAIMGLVSITQGLSNDVSEQLEIFGPQNVIVIPGEIRQGRGIVASTLAWRDLEIISKLPYVDKAIPIIANKMAKFEIRGDTYVAEVYGITHEYDDINKNTELSKGRAILRSDSAAMIVGSNSARPDESKDPILEVGDRVEIQVNVGEKTKSMTLRVVGVLKETGGSFGTNLDDAIAIPLREAQQLFEIGGEFDFIMARADDLDKVDEVAKAIEEKLGDRVSTITYESARDMVGEVLNTIEAVLGGIAAISLIVAGVGIINTMTVSVMERTREIGTLKAIGAKSREVLLIFLSEAMITGLIGGIVGALFGVFISNVIGAIINLPPDPSTSLGILVVAFAIITCVCSGLYPAWRASNLDPVEALRHE
ncbi:MAG: ABC transporter permease [Candidatus Bathyarchaeia archaeon]